MEGHRELYRTSFSPFVPGQFCVRAGAILPGTPTIPDQIVDNRNPYFDALDAADLAWKEGRVDVSKMEDLLGALLAQQLASFYKSIGGKLPSSVAPT